MGSPPLLRVSKPAPATSDDGIVHWNDTTPDWVATAMGRLPGFKESIEIGLDITP